MKNSDLKTTIVFENSQNSQLAKKNKLTQLVITKNILDVKLILFFFFFWKSVLFPNIVYFKTEIL